AHSKKIPVFLDAAQAVAHFPLRLNHVNADYAAFSGHKLFGPTGIGVLYGRKALLEKLPIVIGGGGSVEKAGVEGTIFRKPPHCFEPGTLPLAEILGLGAAIDFLNEVGWEKITVWEKILSECLSSGLQKISGLKIVGTSKRDTPLFSFTLEGVHPHDLAAFLDSRGIAIRAGHHCAGPLHRSLGLAATARISLSFFNTEKECERICLAIREARVFFTGKKK
ncbi:MAG: aminotransferase class V-fold PLP-dependent enzyme, partial [Spirochaetia bacterium]|nr:aminotransferase class V-fold PLP-dependent enzyme [Spirochaetia bacterium]